jgi:hypothetical protein
MRSPTAGTRAGHRASLSPIPARMAKYGNLAEPRMRALFPLSDFNRRTPFSGRAGSPVMRSRTPTAVRRGSGCDATSPSTARQRSSIGSMPGSATRVPSRPCARSATTAALPTAPSQEVEPCRIVGIRQDHGGVGFRGWRSPDHLRLTAADAKDDDRRRADILGGGNVLVRQSGRRSAWVWDRPPTRRLRARLVTDEPDRPETGGTPAYPRGPRRRASRPARTATRGGASRRGPSRRHRCR